MKYAAVFFDWGDTLGTELRINDWAGGMIRRLYTASYRLAIISNTHRYQDAEWIRKRLAEANALSCFECIVSSAIYGCHKPDTKIFLKALNFMEIDPCRVLMVGDSERADGGCQLLGMSYMHVTRGEHWERRLYDALADNFPSCRKLSRIVEFGLRGDRLIVKLRHLSEPIKAGDHLLLDQDEYVVIKAERSFTKDDVLKSSEEYVEFVVRSHK